MISTEKCLNISNRKKYQVYDELRKSGLYFLIKNGRIVYIGQSNHITQRISNHHTRIEFDYFRIIYLSPELLDHYEGRLIRIFEPSLNRNKLYKWILVDGVRKCVRSTGISTAEEKLIRKNEMDRIKAAQEEKIDREKANIIWAQLKAKSDHHKNQNRP